MHSHQVFFGNSGMDSAVESQITIEIVGSTSEVDQRKLSGPFGLSKSRTTHPNLPVFWGIGIWKCSDRLAKNLRHRRIWTIIWCSMFQNTWTRLWEILQTLFETLFLLDSLLPHFHQGYKIGASSWIVCKDAPEGPKNANVFVVFVSLTPIPYPTISQGLWHHLYQEYCLLHKCCREKNTHTL